MNAPRGGGRQACCHHRRRGRETRRGCRLRSALTIALASAGELQRRLTGWLLLRPQIRFWRRPCPGEERGTARLDKSKRRIPPPNTVEFGRARSVASPHRLVVCVAHKTHWARRGDIYREPANLDFPEVFVFRAGWLNWRSAARGGKACVGATSPRLPIGDVGRGARGRRAQGGLERRAPRWLGDRAPRKKMESADQSRVRRDRI
jgi:hypothetical protein